MKHDNTRLGIASIGDYVNGEASVRKLLANFESKLCDIVVCACTTDKPKTLEAVEKYSPRVIITKSKATGEPGRRILDFKYAKKMLDKI